MTYLAKGEFAFCFQRSSRNIDGRVIQVTYT